MDLATQAELQRRFPDPVDIANAERFHRFYTKRMDRLGQHAGAAAMLDATRRSWRRAFGFEWPRTRAEV